MPANGAIRRVTLPSRHSGMRHATLSQRSSLMRSCRGARTTNPSFPAMTMTTLLGALAKCLRLRRPRGFDNTRGAAAVAHPLPRAPPAVRAAASGLSRLLAPPAARAVASALARRAFRGDLVCPPLRFASPLRGDLVRRSRAIRQSLPAHRRPLLLRVRPRRLRKRRCSCRKLQRPQGPPAEGRQCRLIPLRRLTRRVACRRL